MRSMKIQAFLSCSFNSDDKQVVDFFHSLCIGVDIGCVNVNKGYCVTPPAQARKLIFDSHALIAVATKREAKASGLYSMPEAVEEEISMAFAQEKPILLFVEKGVDTNAGFVKNLGTYLEFERTSLYTPEFIAKAIASIHGMKMGVISPQELQLEQQGQEHIFAETNRLLIELVDLGTSYLWRYSTTRYLRFTSRFLDPIKAAAWAAVSTKDAPESEKIRWRHTVHQGSKSFVFKPVMVSDSVDHCEVSFEIEPKPEANDTLEYSTVFESPYLNPLCREDLKDNHPHLVVGSNKYLCYDGVVPILRTKDLKLQLRFPASLGLAAGDFAPFVGCYTNKIDYLVESEMKRVAITTDSYGGSVFFELSIQSPLLFHMYGVAWNPPARKK